MSRIAAMIGFSVLTAFASATPPPDDFYVDVRGYLPQGYVIDGSVDYKPHIQKCFDENPHVIFPGSDDPTKPMVYGVTGAKEDGILKTRPKARIRFGPNAVLKRLPSFGDLFELGHGTHLTGAVIDGNKYAHWPLVRDRPVKPYAFVIGHAVTLRGGNVIRDCFVYNNAGIAIGGWYASDNRIYRSRVENCGFLEALREPVWAGEHASADGFFFYRESHYNIVKDSEAIDCARWGFVVEGGSAYNTFVDCRGGDVHVRTFGFIDVESAGPGNSLVRCRSPNSDLSVQSYFQDAVGCTARKIWAEHASYPRFLGCTSVGGWFRFGEVREDRFVTPGRESPMLGHNRFLLGGVSSDHSLTVICADGRGLATNNVLYGSADGDRRSTEMLLFGVGSRSGNIQSGDGGKEPIGQFARPYYLRARTDDGFKRSE